MVLVFGDKKSMAEYLRHLGSIERIRVTSDYYGINIDCSNCERNIVFHGDMKQGKINEYLKEKFNNKCPHCKNELFAESISNKRDRFKNLYGVVV